MDVNPGIMFTQAANFASTNPLQDNFLDYTPFVILVLCKAKFLIIY